MRRFRGSLAAGGPASRFEIGLRLPLGGSNGGGTATSSELAPFVAACVSIFPASDYSSAVLSIYGLRESSVVEWTAAGEVHNFLQNGGTVCADAVCIACYAGGEMMVSASVDGVIVGEIDIAAYFGAGAACYPITTNP